MLHAVLKIGVSIGALALMLSPPVAIGQVCSPVVLSEDLMAPSLWDSRAYGDYIVGSGWGGFAVIDVADPTNPVVVFDSGQGSGAFHGLDIQGSFAYVVDQVSGLRVFDLTDPEAPVNISTTPVSPGVFGWSVAVDGDFAYVGWLDRISVFDISDPALPALVGETLNTMSPYRMLVVGNHLHVISIEGGYVSHDISDPTSPSLAASIAFPSQGCDIAVDGDTIYLAHCGPNRSLRSIDISDPTNPSIIGSLSLINAATSLSVLGDRLILGQTDKVTIVDISDPANLSVISAVEISEESTTSSVVGSSVFIGSFDVFMATIDISSCLCPADTNGDGVLAPDDFTAWIDAFNAGDPECDQNNDGTCNPTDFTAWIANFNAGCG